MDRSGLRPTDRINRLKEATLSQPRPLSLDHAVFEERTVRAMDLLAALRSDFKGKEDLREYLLQGIPKYGNDVEWVDEFGGEWARHFAQRLERYQNARGGAYHAGFYTVSVHVPMGKSVAATPDGRRGATPR